MLSSYTLQEELKKNKLPTDAIVDQLLNANHEFFLYRLQETHGKNELVDVVIDEFYSMSSKLGKIQDFYHSFEKAMKDISIERIVIPIIDSSIVTLSKQNMHVDNFSQLFCINHKNNTYMVKLYDPTSNRFIGHYGVLIYYKNSNEFHYFDAMNDETFYLKYCIMMRILLMFSSVSPTALSIRAPLFKYEKLQKSNDNFSCGHFVLSFVEEYKNKIDENLLERIENKRDHFVKKLNTHESK